MFWQVMLATQIFLSQPSDLKAQQAVDAILSEPGPMNFDKITRIRALRAGEQKKIIDDLNALGLKAAETARGTFQKSFDEYSSAIAEQQKKDGSDASNADYLTPPNPGSLDTLAIFQSAQKARAYWAYLQYLNRVAADNPEMEDPALFGQKVGFNYRNLVMSAAQQFLFTGTQKDTTRQKMENLFLQQVDDVGYGLLNKLSTFEARFAIDEATVNELTGKRYADGYAAVERSRLASRYVYEKVGALLSAANSFEVDVDLAIDEDWLNSELTKPCSQRKTNQKREKALAAFVAAVSSFIGAMPETANLGSEIGKIVDGVAKSSFQGCTPIGKNLSLALSQWAVQGILSQNGLASASQKIVNLSVMPAASRFFHSAMASLWAKTKEKFNRSIFPYGSGFAYSFSLRDQILCWITRDCEPNIGKMVYERTPSRLLVGSSPLLANAFRGNLIDRQKFTQKDVFRPIVAEESREFIEVLDSTLKKIVPNASQSIATSLSANGRAKPVVDRAQQMISKFGVIPPATLPLHAGMNPDVANKLTAISASTDAQLAEFGRLQRFTAFAAQKNLIRLSTARRKLSSSTAVLSGALQNYESSLLTLSTQDLARVCTMQLPRLEYITKTAMANSCEVTTTVNSVVPECPQVKITRRGEQHAVWDWNGEEITLNDPRFAKSPWCFRVGTIAAEPTLKLFFEGLVKYFANKNFSDVLRSRILQHYHVINTVFKKSEEKNKWLSQFFEHSAYQRANSNVTVASKTSSDAFNQLVDRFSSKCFSALQKPALPQNISVRSIQIGGEISVIDPACKSDPEFLAIARQAVDDTFTDYGLEDDLIKFTNALIYTWKTKRILKINLFFREGKWWEGRGTLEGPYTPKQDAKGFKNPLAKIFLPTEPWYASIRKHKAFIPSSIPLPGLVSGAYFKSPEAGCGMDSLTEGSSKNFADDLARVGDEGYVGFLQQHHSCKEKNFKNLWEASRSMLPRLNLFANRVLGIKTETANVALLGGAAGLAASMTPLSRATLNLDPTGDDLSFQVDALAVALALGSDTFLGNGAAVTDVTTRVPGYFESFKSDLTKKAVEAVLWKLAYLSVEKKMNLINVEASSQKNSVMQEWRTQFKDDRQMVMEGLAGVVVAQFKPYALQRLKWVSPQMFRAASSVLPQVSELLAGYYPGNPQFTQDTYDLLKEVVVDKLEELSVALDAVCRLDYAKKLPPTVPSGTVPENADSVDTIYSALLDLKTSEFVTRFSPFYTLNSLRPLCPQGSQSAAFLDIDESPDERRSRLERGLKALAGKGVFYSGADKLETFKAARLDSFNGKDRETLRTALEDIAGFGEAYAAGRRSLFLHLNEAVRFKVVTNGWDYLDEKPLEKYEDEKAQFSAMTFGCYGPYTGEKPGEYLPFKIVLGNETVDIFQELIQNAGKSNNASLGNTADLIVARYNEMAYMQPEDPANIEFVPLAPLKQRAKATWAKFEDIQKKFLVQHVATGLPEGVAPILNKSNSFALAAGDWMVSTGLPLFNPLIGTTLSFLPEMGGLLSNPFYTQAVEPFRDALVKGMLDLAKIKHIFRYLGDITAEVTKYRYEYGGVAGKPVPEDKSSFEERLDRIFMDDVLSPQRIFPATASVESVAVIADQMEEIVGEQVLAASNWSATVAQNQQKLQNEVGIFVLTEAITAPAWLVPGLNSVKATLLATRLGLLAYRVASTVRTVASLYRFGARVELFNQGFLAFERNIVRPQSNQQIIGIENVPADEFVTAIRTNGLMFMMHPGLTWLIKAPVQLARWTVGAAAPRVVSAIIADTFVSLATMGLASQIASATAQAVNTWMANGNMDFHLSIHLDEAVKMTIFGLPWDNAFAFSRFLAKNAAQLSFLVNSTWCLMMEMGAFYLGEKTRDVYGQVLEKESERFTNALFSSLAMPIGGALGHNGRGHRDLAMGLLRERLSRGIAKGEDLSQIKTSGLTNEEIRLVALQLPLKEVTKANATQANFLWRVLSGEASTGTQSPLLSELASMREYYTERGSSAPAPGKDPAATVKENLLHLILMQVGDGALKIEDLAKLRAQDGSVAATGVIFEHWLQTPLTQGLTPSELYRRLDPEKRAEFLKLVSDKYLTPDVRELPKTPDDFARLDLYYDWAKKQWAEQFDNANLSNIYGDGRE